MMEFLRSLPAIFSSSRSGLIPIVSVTVATAANNLLAFVINILAARNLGAEEFGIFSLAFSLATFIGVVGDLGFNLSMVRLYNKYQSDLEKQTLVLDSALGFKGLLLLSVTALSFPLGGALTQYFGLGLEAKGLFAATFFTGGLLFVWTYLQSYLQAHRSFGKLTAFIWAYSGLRLVFLLAVYYLFSGNVTNWFLALYTFPLVFLSMAGLASIGWNARILDIRRFKISLSLLRELLTYGKWVAISTIAYTAMPYIVRVNLTTHASIAELGIFSAGMTFTVAFSTLNTAIRAVLFPQITAYHKEDMQAYLTRLNRLAPYYAIFAILGIVGLGLTQWLILGDEYRMALPVFLITSGALAGVIFMGFRTMMVHTLMRPEVDTYVNIFRLVLMSLLAYVLIPKLGAIGAALAYSISLLIGEAYSFYYVTKKVTGDVRGD